MTFSDLADRAAEELRQATRAIDPHALAGLIDALAGAGRIVVYGAGREGLMMRALAMRLCHLGLDAHVAGDMSAPPVGPGDLLMLAAGPGVHATVAAFAGVAHAAGARIACVTARPQAVAPLAADLLLVIPAQTMADDRGPAATSVLPMGSLFEGAMFLTFEILVLGLRDRLGVTPEEMRARHTNLE